MHFPLEDTVNFDSVDQGKLERRSPSWIAVWVQTPAVHRSTGGAGCHNLAGLSRFLSFISQRLISIGSSLWHVSLAV
jgi:hypothetical protein